MSTTVDTSRVIASCRPATGTPVTLHADAIESTAVDSLQSLKDALDDAGYVPSELVITADFGADCSLTTQAEADRIREYLHAAGFLGAGAVRLDIESVADEAKVRPAVTALRERAARDGLTLRVTGDAHDL